VFDDRPADRDERLPLPSEDTGDLVDEPASGMSDDYLVAQEEGVPYAPPTDRTVTSRGARAGADVAGTAATDAGELERADAVQPEDGEPPRDDELLADVIEALRDSDLLAGDRIRVGVSGRVITVRGQVESIDVLDELIGLIADVPGVDEVVDEVDVVGV
jgi:hypothetical protein